MAFAKIRIKVRVGDGDEEEGEYGLEHLAYRYRRVAEEVSDLRPLWDQVAIIFARAEGRWFDSQGGGTWDGWRGRYAYMRNAAGGGMILQSGSFGGGGGTEQSFGKYGGVGGDTIDLKDSLTDPAYFVKNKNRRSVTFASDVPYARYHVEGFVPSKGVWQPDWEPGAVDGVGRDLVQGFEVPPRDPYAPRFMYERQFRRAAQQFLERKIRETGL